MATRNLLLAAIERTAKGIAMAIGAPEPLFKVSESIPVDVNDGPLARRINAAFVRDLGRQRSGHGNKRTWSRMISPISSSPI